MVDSVRTAPRGILSSAESFDMFFGPYSANPYSTLTWVLCNLLYLFDFTRLINGASSHVICQGFFQLFV